MRLELTRVGLLVELPNHYTTAWCSNSLTTIFNTLTTMPRGNPFPAKIKIFINLSPFKDHKYAARCADLSHDKICYFYYYINWFYRYTLTELSKLSAQCKLYNICKHMNKLMQVKLLLRNKKINKYIPL